MAKDLRSWIRDVAKAIPGEPLRVSRTVNPSALEVSAVLEQLEARGRLEAVLFERVTSVKGGPVPFQILSHVFTTPEKIAVALEAPGSSRVALFETYLDRWRQACPTERVSPSESPVKEIVVREPELDLAELPIVRHHPLDGGPYFTPVLVARAPESDRYNTSWNRMMYLDARHLAIYMSPRHLWSYCLDMERQGRPMPAAVILGHHPAFMLSASALVPLEEDEYAVAGGILGEPVRVVPSESYGEALLVPADAEAIIEGEIVPGRRTIEGPFGEFTGFSGPQRLSWLFRARALTRRREPILLSVFAAHRDHLRAHFPIEASLFQSVRRAVPGVRDLTWLQSGGPFHLVISLRKRTEGEPMRAAMAALAASNFIKHVIVVDEDIEPGDPEQVLWAVATCAQGDTDVTILRNLQGHVLDPSLRHEVKGSGIVIDATRPLDRPYPRRARLPVEVVSKFPLGDYLDL